MYSRNHGILSVCLGVLVAIAGLVDRPLIAISYVTTLGIVIDLDHFVVARWNRGNWSNLHRCIQSPRRIVTGQASIFDPGDVWRDQRLLTHSVLGGSLTAGAWFLDPAWALLTALTVYVHVVADLYSDTRTREQYVTDATSELQDS